MANKQRKRTLSNLLNAIKTIIRKCKKGGENLRSTRQDYSIKSDIKAVIDCVKWNLSQFNLSQNLDICKTSIYQIRKGRSIRNLNDQAISEFRREWMN